MPTDHPSHAVADPAHNGHKTLGSRLHRFLVPVPKLEPPINPALLKREEERADAAQNRIADKITAFSGSMLFVYIHIIWFGCWIGFGVEKYPFGLLTMIVSLEAIFLSTFVMISQNRADARRQVIADQQWKDGSGRGQAERRADRHLEADPVADEGGPRSCRPRRRGRPLASLRRPKLKSVVCAPGRKKRRRTRWPIGSTEQDGHKGQGSGRPNSSRTRQGQVRSRAGR
jgi:hypothetical protein